MSNPHVVIAGGGIGGLSVALTLHQIGVSFTVYETVSTLRPLGVGINLQPNAVRELYNLGITADDLDTVGLPVKEWALVGLNGNDIYAEPRGGLAGYNWPQYAVHRGKFHMMLYRKLGERAGEDVVRLGHQVVGYEQTSDGVDVQIFNSDGTESRASGTLLIGADGIHSKVRAHMHPDQPAIHWGGAVMWRGTSRAKPIRSGSSFVGLGTHEHRMVIYPISHPDPDTGLAEINWIAEVTYDDPSAFDPESWFRQVPLSDFAHHFDSWNYDWLNVPELLSDAEVVYENPMIDRDPIPTWQDGAVALMGDAAHAMYPTGSNGASQALIDARVLGACLVEHGVGEDALSAYNQQLCGPVSDLILRNRGAGPFGLLNVVDERCGGTFDNIDDVIPKAERNDFMAKYKAAAGFAIEELNAADDTIAKGAVVGGVSG